MPLKVTTLSLSRAELELTEKDQIIKSTPSPASDKAKPPITLPPNATPGN